MAKERKKGGGEAEDKGESAPLWIISFCDLALVMLSFFVILSALNSRPDSSLTPEFLAAVEAIKKAFGHIPDSNVDGGVDTDALMKKLPSLLKKKTGTGGNSGNKGDADQNIPGAKGNNEMVKTVRSGLQTTIGGTLPFERGSPQITAEADRTLKEISAAIRGHMHVFDVKGHTSKDEEYELQNANRDLGYERARAIVARLVELGVERKVMRVKSCRDFEPLQQGTYSETALAVNRRVEVVATEALVHEYEGQRVDLTAPTDAVLTGERPSPQ